MSESDSEVSSNPDSDAELQEAFKKGQLKGLCYEARAKPAPIYNKAALKKSLESLRNGLGWLERLDLCVDPVPPPPPLRSQLGDDPDDLSGDNVHDDFKREMKFYRQAQAAVMIGCPRLKTMGVPTIRPKDYFAEMVKSDAHMDKIRRKLLSVKQSQERSEKAKKLRELKKFGKQVQREVLQRRQKEKKEMLNAVKAYKKGKTKSLDFLEDNKQQRGAGSAAQQSNNNQQQLKKNQLPNKKRQLKNARFGFGGQKKRSKMNTRDSVDSFGGSRGGQGVGRKEGAKLKAIRRSFGADKRKNKKNVRNRPGKRRRVKERNRQKN